MAQEHAGSRDLCSALIDLANARGGPDNITVVAARFEGEGLPERRDRRGRPSAISPGTGLYARPRPSAPDSADSPQTHEHGSRVAPQAVASYGSSPDVMRTVALILVTVGVLLLLLAVWQ